MSSLQTAGRQGLRFTGHRIEYIANWLERRGRRGAAAVLRSFAHGLVRGTGPGDSMGFALGELLEQLDLDTDLPIWNQLRDQTRASVVGAGVAVGAAGIGTLVAPSVLGKRTRSSDVPKEQRYNKLQVVPVLGFKEQDGDAMELVNEAGGSLQVPKLSTLARRVVARQKQKAWLIRHNRKQLAKALQSRYAHKRIIRAQARRQRFVRKFIKNFRWRRSQFGPRGY